MKLDGLGKLIETVQRNCDIADARHARNVTLCTYLLEMREFFRWEHGLTHVEVPPRAEVGRWISEREGLWEHLEHEDFASLPLAGTEFDPFAAAEVNEVLHPAGLVYGAGVGRFGKPHFFLASLGRAERHDGLSILVCECEYARDITAIPAALQGGTVIVRREALRQWLWQKTEAWNLRQAQGPMARALAAYGEGADAAAALERMTEAETETLILHERGEHAAGQILGPAWEDMLSGFMRRRAEIVARAVRDNWADCLSTLPALLRRENHASLHFWHANFDGMRSALFPRLSDALSMWNEKGDAAPVAAAVEAGREHWQRVAGEILARGSREGGEEALEDFSRDLAAIAL